MRAPAGWCWLDRLPEPLASPQELLVATHSMVPCGHSYCGECIASWLQNKADCPTCRVQATAAPIRQLMTDNIVEELVSQVRGAALEWEGRQG